MMSTSTDVPCMQAKGTILCADDFYGDGWVLHFLVPLTALRGRGIFVVFGHRHAYSSFKSYFTTEKTYNIDGYWFEQYLLEREGEQISMKSQGTKSCKCSRKRITRKAMHMFFSGHITLSNHKRTNHDASVVLKMQKEKTQKDKREKRKCIQKCWPQRFGYSAC